MPNTITGFTSSGQRVPRPKKPRDSQRGRVYRAEGVMKAHSEKVADPKLDMKGVEEYVAGVWKSPWTRRQFSRAQYYTPPRIADGRGTRSATGSLHRISLPRWSRTKWVMLHEIAHALTAERPAHGWVWAKNYLALVQHFMGVEAATRLSLSFRLQKVRFRPPRKMSPEAKAALVARGRVNLQAWKAKQLDEVRPAAHLVEGVEHQDPSGQ